MSNTVPGRATHAPAPTSSAAAAEISRTSMIALSTLSALLFFSNAFVFAAMSFASVSSPGANVVSRRAVRADVRVKLGRPRRGLLVHNSFGLALRGCSRFKYRVCYLPASSRTLPAWCLTNATRTHRVRRALFGWGESREARRVALLWAAARQSMRPLLIADKMETRKTAENGQTFSLILGGKGSRDHLRPRSPGL